jgi:hypothetical protein
MHILDQGAPTGHRELQFVVVPQLSTVTLHQQQLPQQDGNTSDDRMKRNHVHALDYNVPMTAITK